VTALVDQRVVTPRLLACVQRTGAFDLASHVAVHGWPKALDLPPSRRSRLAPWAEELLTDIEDAGLTGRGGAAFPTARKLRAVLSTRRRPVVVVNAMEGEPASMKDQVLLSFAPHLVIDGAELLAAAIGAKEVLICLPDDRIEVGSVLRATLAERDRAGLLRSPVHVATPPGRYLVGEESALVDWIRGGPGLPVFRPSKGAPLTLGPCVALVHNAETLAHVALIARHGPEWFRSAGVPGAPGTCLVTLSGAVARPGVYEIEMGTPVADIIDLGDPTATPAAALVGGYGGGWIPSSAFKAPYTPSAMRELGAATGPGILVALGSASCLIAETARILGWLAAERAGQCGPCTYGLPAIAEDLAQLARGTGDRGLLRRLERRTGQIAGRGACRHPDGAVRLVQSVLRNFPSEVSEHAQGRPCASALGETPLPLGVPHWP